MAGPDQTVMEDAAAAPLLGKEVDRVDKEADKLQKLLQEETSVDTDSLQAGEQGAQTPQLEVTFIMGL